jgi:multisubunit Na+/H+ antiporter MnhB subunit
MLESIMRELLAGVTTFIVMPVILLAAIACFFSGAVGPGLGFLVVLTICAGIAYVAGS